jgi:hypothetical protein
MDKVLLIALIILFLVILFKKIEGIFENKKAKRQRDFIRKMKDYDRKTYRY